VDRKAAAWRAIGCCEGSLIVCARRQEPVSGGYIGSEAPWILLRPFLCILFLLSRHLSMTAAVPAHAMHSGIDPFTGRGRGFWSSLISAVLATALFRCWHILLFFTGWATAITVISKYVHTLAIQSTLLTVLVPITDIQLFYLLKKFR
jgi:hypothetical protein